MLLFYDRWHDRHTRNGAVLSHPMAGAMLKVLGAVADGDLCPGVVRDHEAVPGSSLIHVITGNIWKHCIVVISAYNLCSTFFVRVLLDLCI